MPRCWMDGLFLSTLPNRGRLDLHLNHSKSLLKQVSEQTRPLDGVDKCIRSFGRISLGWKRSLRLYHPSLPTHQLTNIHVGLVRMVHYWVNYWKKWNLLTFVTLIHCWPIAVGLCYFCCDIILISDHVVRNLLWPHLLCFHTLCCLF